MRTRRRTALLLGIAAVLLLLVGGRRAAEFVGDLLWYRSLGAEEIFWTRWLAGSSARAAATLLFGAVIFANLWLVTRSLGSIRVRRRFANIEIAERLPQAYVAAAVLLVSLLSAWWLSAGIPDPIALLAALRPAEWGVRDPVFGRDAAFYVFRLPVLGRLQTLVGLLLAWTALLVLSAYVATGAVKLQEGRLSLAPMARRHLGALAGAFLLVVAWDLWLGRYALLLQGEGVGGSLGYTDVNARLPALQIAALLALVAAAAVGVGGWHARLRLALAGFALFVVGSMAARVAFPALTQKLVVEPNEIGRERPFIEQHLRFTRLAYALTEVRTVRLPYREPTALSEREVLRAVAGAPLWDPRPLLTAFNEKEALYRYYTFNSVHPDRYGADPVAIGVRELDPAQLPPAARTWQNLHLTYVSGAGAVVSPSTRMAADGSPLYYLRDLDPPKLRADAPPALQLRDPAVYFGEKTRGYVVVDAPGGPTGVPLSSLWRKLTFAWAFQSRNLLLSGEVTPESRIVYRRHILERVHALAPFLHLLPDGGALPVVHDGRIVWIVDGYTTSESFPLSHPTILGNERVRYVRNSVKATVDAVSGDVRFYALDAQDPILRTYAQIFPGLMRPLEEMPPGLREHLRFPAPLLRLQAETLENYHLTDPERFYAREDVWAIATERFRNEVVPVDPTYAMLALPGEESREFVLSIPLAATGRPNLAALLVARNDPPRYGERILYELPRDQLVPGPQQIEAQIDQDPEISQQLSLWKEGGSEVIRGHLIVVPVDSTLVYVEPLYLEAEQTAIPQLQRVVLATAERAVMRPTVAGAVSALVGPGEGPGEGAAEDPAEAPAVAGAAGANDVSALARARRLAERAEAQLRAGDWAGFGQSWRALRELLGGGPPE